MASSHTSTMARVVVGVDGSPHSESALLAAADLAAAAGVRVHVVEAWQRRADDQAPEARAEVQDQLETTVEQILGAGWPPDTQLTVIEGDTVAVLVDASRGALNLVIGAHDQSVATHRSVVAEVVAQAQCAVTVVDGERQVIRP